MMLVGMLMAFNEVESGNLERCLKSLRRYCDEIVVYDDGSTDTSRDYYEKYNCQVIYGTKNDFKSELEHKQQQLELCKAIGADWILRIDADEVIELKGELQLRDLLIDGGKPSYAFHTINFWRSPAFYRLDSSYNDVIFNRLWKCHKDLRFRIEKGLHLTNYPIGATDNEGMAPFEILHYGFASDKAIIDKYTMYSKHGQSGWALNRLVDESTLKLARSKPQWFADGPPVDNFKEVFSCSIRSLIGSLHC